MRPFNHAYSKLLRKINELSMRWSAIVQTLMLDFCVFRKRYRYLLWAKPFSEHDLSLSMLGEASNHALQAEVELAHKIMQRLSGVKRGVIYAWANWREKREIAHNLRRQVELLKEKMKRDCVEEAENPIEDVSLGLNFGRKGLKRVLEITSAKRVDCIYVSSLDRLGRQVFETRHFIYRLNLEGIIVRWIEKEECNSDD